MAKNEIPYKTRIRDLKQRIKEIRRQLSLVDASPPGSDPWLEYGSPQYLRTILEPIVERLDNLRKERRRVQRRKARRVYEARHPERVTLFFMLPPSQKTRGRER